MTPTTIRRIEAAPLTIALNEPFGIAGGAQDIANNVLVTVELADGTRGYGEAAPFPAFNGETQLAALDAVAAARPSVEGADARAWRALAAAVKTSSGMVGSARCAIETAVLDALTKHHGMPLWAFFGGATTVLETDMTITTGGVAQAEAAARAILARGIGAIKVKVGGGDVALDVARVAAIRAVAPGAPLILDGNAGFSRGDALRFVAELTERGIAPHVLEQLVVKDDHAGLLALRRLGVAPVAADESADGVAAALALCAMGAVDIVNIKLMKCGVAEALDIAAVARAAGVGLMIGGMVESILAMSMSACFAAGQGGFGIVDLDTPLFLAENPFRGGMTYAGGRLDLGGIEAGHGVVPRSD